MSSLLILTSDENELNDISKRLKEDGLKINLSDEHKLRHVWRCLQRAEHSLKSALEDVDKLRHQHAEEMIEVENYVSNIRQLSEEREALTLEFEAENEQLKGEIIDKNSGNFICVEINELLMAHGLRSLIDKHVKDQVTHLLNQLQSFDFDFQAMKNENSKVKAEADYRVAKIETSSNSLKADFEEQIKKMQENIRLAMQEKGTSFDVEIEKMREEKLLHEQEIHLHRTKLNDLQENVDDLKSVIVNERKQHEINLNDVTKTLESKVINITELKDKEKEIFDKKIVQYNSLEVDFRKLTVALDNAEKQENDLMDQVKILQDKLATCNLEIVDLVAEKKTLEKDNYEKVTEKDVQSQNLKEKLTIENKLIVQKHLEKIQHLLDNQERSDILLQNHNNKITEQIEQIQALEKEIQGLEIIIIEKEDKNQENCNIYDQKKNEVSSLSYEINNLLSQKTGLQKMLLSQEKDLNDLQLKSEGLCKKCEELEFAYQFEREQKDDIETRLESLIREHTSAQTYIIQLKEEVKSLTSQLTKHQDISLQEQGKFHSITSSLHTELEQEREARLNQTTQLALDLTEANNSCQNLRSQLKESDIKSQKFSVQLEQISKSATDLSYSLDKESILHVEFENKAKSLQSDLCEQQGQIKELNENISELELSNFELQKELNLKYQLVQELDSSLSKRQTEYTAVSITKDGLQSKLQAYEQQSSALMLEVEMLKQRIQKAHDEIKFLAVLKTDIKKKHEEIKILKAKLNEEEKAKIILNEAITEFQKQTEILESHIEQQEKISNNLKTHLNDRGHCLKALKLKYQQSSKLHIETVGLTKSLNNQILDIFEENEILKAELYSSSNKFEELQQKYDEKMEKFKAKIHILQDRYTREKRAFETLISQLQNNLEIARSRIQYETKWVLKSNDYISKKYLEEKSELFSKIVGLEENIRDQSIDHKKDSIKNGHLEVENQELRENIEYLTKEKHELEKWCNELQSREPAHSDFNKDLFTSDSFPNYLTYFVKKKL